MQRLSRRLAGDRMRRSLGLLLVLLFVARGAALQETALTPAAVAARLQTRFDQIQDYECVMQTETRAGSKVEAASFRIWYRRLGLLRLRVLKGRRKGSELVMGADGSLRGRRGGLLRPFSRRLSRSDPSLRSLRGQPAWELDFGSFIRALRERLALPGSRATVQQPTSAEPHLTLEIHYRPPDAAGPLRDVWFIDPQSWLLARGDVYDGVARVDHFEFGDIRLDQGLKESWFHF
jgi:outer membrane lipoprotein-sorting protein